MNTLTRAQIYCSNPLTFNDPWDGKPHIRSDDFGEPRRAEQVARYFERVARPPMAGLRVSRDPDALKTLIGLANPELEKAIGRMYRVYCLSPFPDINLMWSHYARGHTGICLEFSRKNIVFGAAQRIIYDEKLPRFDIDRGEDQAHLMLTTKSDEWAYEREYRLIVQAGEASENKGTPLFVTRKNYLELKSR
jgi:hypothetical protein